MNLKLFKSKLRRKKAVPHVMAACYGFLAYTIFTFSDALMKLAGTSQVPKMQALTIMGLSATLSVIIFCAARGRLKYLKNKKPKIELLRSLLMTALVFLGFFAVINLPLAIFYTGIFATPMLTSVMAAIFLKEKLPMKKAIAILFGFAGVLIAIDPLSIDTASGKSLSYLALAACPLIAATTVLLTRIEVRTETPESLTLYPYVIRVIIFAPFCLWSYAPIGINEWLYVIGAGTFNAISYMLLSFALKNANAATVVPFQYTQLITGSAIGYVLWSDKLSLNLIIGASIIIASGLFMVFKAQKKPTAEPLPEI